MIKELDLSDADLFSIHALDGIEHLTSLEKLICVDGVSNLDSLDVSKNTALTYLDCSDKGLLELNVSENKSLETLICKDNPLHNLDVSENTALKTLDCESNQLSSLDVSHNALLEILNCGGNNLTDLDLRINTALKVLYCGGNQLSSLDVSHNALLETLDCVGNSMTNLNVSGNTALKTLVCFYNQLTNLDLRTNTALEVLECYENQLTSLDVSHNVLLKKLWCQVNKLTNLDLGKNTALEMLFCFGNQLGSLDVSHNTLLKVLNCERINLAHLDVSENTALETLYCDGNQLSSLDVSRNVFLRFLSCAENNLTHLDVSENTDLEVLWCYGNRLNSLDVSHNTLLKNLGCLDNNLASLDLTNMNSVLNIDFIDFSGQERKTYAVQSDGVFKIDIGELVGAENIDRVSFEPESGYEIHYANGIAEINTDDLPTDITYQYDTKAPENPYGRYMTVHVTITKKCEEGKHKFGDWIIEEKPSYTAAGRQVRICSVCGFQEEEILEQLKSVITFSKEEIYLNIGDTTLLSEQINKTQADDLIVSWESDNLSVASVEADGKATAKDIGVAAITVTTQSGASATITLNVYCGSLDEPDHAYKEVIEKAATCTEDGKAYQKCSDCGKIGSERVLPATGHQFGAYQITKEETVFEAGLEESTCSACGATQKRERPKLEPKIQLTAEEISVQIGKTASLETYVKGLQKGDAISAWKSDSTDIVSVDGSGKATAIEVGTAVITVTTKGGASGKIRIKVYCGSLEKPDHTYEEVIEKAATCTEDGKAYQKCSGCGKIGSERVLPATGHQFGAYRITKEETVFETGLEESTCSACGTTQKRERPKLEPKIQLTAEEISVQIGKTASLETYVKGLQKGDSISAWKSDRTDIVSVDGSGKATANEVGTAVVTITTKGGASGKIRIKVYCGSEKEPNHTYTEVIEKAATCTEDGKAYQKCSGCGKKKDGSDRVIAAKGHQFGPYKVTVEATVFKVGTKTSTCTVCGATQTQTVPQLKATVSYSTNSLKLQVGKSVSIKSYVTGMQNGDSISRWRSFAPNIASVDTNGTVKALKAGQAYIAVGTKAGAVAKLLVTVEDHTPHTTGISGLHTGIALEAGKTVALRPVITPSNSIDPIIYRSVAPNIATVTANGVIKGIRAGYANVYVKSGTVYKKILVKVTAPTLTAITSVRKTGSLYVGATYQLRPQRYPVGSAGVFYYKSSNSAVAAVDKNGKITAKKKGTTVITVTARNVSTTLKLTVK